ARSACDLIQAHTWRAARLLDALDLVTSAGCSRGSTRSVGRIVDEVIDGYGAEARLSNLKLEAHVSDEIPPSGVTDHELQTGLAAALLATLPLVENTAAPTLLVTAAAGR